jgi:hypothetical protein
MKCSNTVELCRLLANRRHDEMRGSRASFDGVAEQTPSRPVDFFEVPEKSRADDMKKS